MVVLPAVCRAGLGQKGVNLTPDRANACDLASIIDRGGVQQIPWRMRRDEFVEVGQRSVLPEEGSAGTLWAGT